MDPLRLQLFLTIAVSNPAFSLVLAQNIILRAQQQLSQRWPLVGCMIQHVSTTPFIITLGRQ